MTAEIAILNRNGVALAADSAVSIGTKKVYNSANKLFALSKQHPVGIMIYGDADYMGTPWETIIKYYRSRSLKSRSFPTLQDYASDFIEFLRTTEIFQKDVEITYLSNQFARFCRSISDIVSEKVNAAVKERAINSDDIVNFIKQTMELLKSHTENLTQAVLLNSTIRTTILNKYESQLDDVISSILEKLPFDNIDRADIKSAFIAILGSSALEHEPHSGVVIAGFGESEIFPHTTNFRIQGRVEGYLRMELRDPASVRNNGAVIVPFAQREMVDTFMSGADPTCVATLTQSFQQILQQLPKIIIEKYGFGTTNKEVISNITSDLDKLSVALREQFERFQKEKFIGPVLSSVGALPLDELASMAESLVSLTSFKRKVTMVQESVGGPIDVAVISKGDGFIWIKRKHYFSPELNHHYFSNATRIDYEH